MSAREYMDDPVRRSGYDYKIISNRVARLERQLATAKAEADAAYATLEAECARAGVEVPKSHRRP